MTSRVVNSLLQYVLILAITCCGTVLKAQQFYVNTSGGGIALIDASIGCSALTSINVGVTFGDIAFHPNGNLYGVTTGGDLYEINLTTQLATFIADVDVTSATGIYVAMTADNDGNMYIATQPGDLINVDVTTGTTTYLGDIGFTSGGDLTFRFGDLYMVSLNNEIVQVDISNPVNSTLFATLTGADNFFGIVTFYDDCNNSTTYVTTSGSNSIIYELDFDTGSLGAICGNSGLNIFGAASPDEFLGADCELRVDLDQDDSSGAIESDFDGASFCFDGTTPITDDDVEIISDNPVDSITITLATGEQNDAAEYLTYAALPNLTASPNNSDQIVLRATASSTLADYVAALEGIVYTNTDPDPAAGQRTVTVVGYALTEVSDVATATVEVLNDPAEPGIDNDVTLCVSQGALQLIDLLNGTPTPGGVWSPSLPGDTFDPSTDTPGDYVYTVTSSCETQSATLSITVVYDLPDAGDDATIEVCNNDAPFDVLALLGPDADPDGNFTPPLPGNQFDPATDLAGNYLYTVSGNGTCPDDNATVTIVVVDQPADAGQDGSATFCIADPTVALFDLLEGTPQSGGEWSPELPADAFDPSENPAGVYTYTVTTPCETASAQVTITLKGDVPNAGVDQQLSYCDNSPAVDLLDLFADDVDLDGTFSPALASDGVFDPSVDAAGDYLYTVTNSDATCPPDEATISIEVTSSAITAGDDVEVALCANAEAVELGTFLSADADVGGTWPQLPGNGLFDPATDVAGDYFYVVDALACGIDTATVSVTIDAIPEPREVVDAFCADSTYTITSPEGSFSVEWEDGSTGFPRIVQDSGVYVGILTDNVTGCQTIESYILSTFNCVVCKVYIPTGFSPNGDGMNDFFMPLFGQCAPQDYAFRVYNRWGALVFESADPFGGLWDGTFRGSDAQPDLYTWYLEYTETVRGETNAVLLTGDVMLMR